MGPYFCPFFCLDIGVHFKQTNPQQPEGPDDPKREFIDSSKFHPEKIRPEDLWPLMSETLDNLDLQEVGRLRWTLLVLSRFVLDY